jgi:hypothetical protein
MRLKNVAGETSSAFDGQGTPDLRYFLDWWCDDPEAPARARGYGRDTYFFVGRIRDEINARYRAGRAKHPAREC